MAEELDCGLEDIASGVQAASITADTGAEPIMANLGLN